MLQAQSDVENVRGLDLVKDEVCKVLDVTEIDLVVYASESVPLGSFRELQVDNLSQVEISLDGFFDLGLFIMFMLVMEWAS